MQLYNANLSPNCLRVRAVIFELGLDVEIIDVDLRATRTPEHLAKNPNGKVPVLVDGDFALWESRAILGYLASVDPARRLYPADAKARAIVDQWLYWQAVHFGPSSQKLAFERVFKTRFKMGEPDQAVIAAETKETTKLLQVLELGLANREWAAGALSIADFALGSTLPARVPAGISLDAFPAVAAWISRLEARPAWQRAVAPLAALTS
jgi:glutathione S-transferase